MTCRCFKYKKNINYRLTDAGNLFIVIFVTENESERKEAMLK